MVQTTQTGCIILSLRTFTAPCKSDDVVRWSLGY